MKKEIPITQKPGTSKAEEYERECIEYEQKRAKAVRIAKGLGEKEELDIREVCRVFSRMPDNPRVNERTSQDPGVISSPEEQYYLEAPANVKTTTDFIRWMGEIEERVGSL